MRIEYYAALREAMGQAAEDVALPEGVASAGSLIDWLRDRDARGAAALTPGRTVHIAIDDAIASPDTSLADAASVSLFPPMTGG